MTYKRFHLIKDRYLFDDYDSGLYFDLAPLARGSGDEDLFNGRIDDADEDLKRAESDPANQAWYCTLFLTDAQLGKLSAKYQQQFAPKSYLLLFRAGFNDNSEWPDNVWNEYFANGMVCNPTGAKDKWIYYTNYNANNLGHRFRIAHKDEVNAYIQPGGTTTPPVEDPAEDPVDDPADDTTGDTTPPSGGISIPTSIDIHIYDHSKPKVW